MIQADKRWSREKLKALTGVKEESSEKDYLKDGIIKFWKQNRRMAKTIQEREAKDIQYGEYPKDILENSLTEGQERKTCSK